MSIVISHKVKRMLKRLAACPECGVPATLIVTPKGMIGWSCERCLKARDEVPRAELDAALDGLAKRGVISPELAEQAKRRIAEGGEP